MTVLWKRIVWALVAVGAIAFAVQAGEYGTTDLLAQRARKRALVASIDSLGRQVDSLRKLRERLETDAALQERIAREEYGMVRGDRELVYWMTEPGARRDTSAAPR